MPDNCRRRETAKVRRLLIGILAAVGLVLVQTQQVSASPASPTQSDLQTVAASQARASLAPSSLTREDVGTEASTPNCCASAWYPWGWYGTKSRCESEGQKVVDRIPVALAYHCYYERTGPPSNPSLHYHLYILEAT